MAKSKTRAQQFADAQQKISKDFDPEEDQQVQDSDDSSDSGHGEDDLAGTEHYVEVGKGKLRKRDEIALGPQYAGAQISREALLDDDEDGHESESDIEDSEGEQDSSTKFADPEDVDIDVDEDDGDIDSDAAFGQSDVEKFESFTFRGSSKPKTPNGAKKRPTAADFMSETDDEEDIIDEDGSDDADTDEDLLDADDQHAEKDDEDQDSEEDYDQDPVSSEDEESEAGSEGGSESESEDGDDETTRRAELRKIMNEEQKTVVATISQAAKADADKGNAVKQQRKAFDSLLSVRMVLQKSLIAMNSMSAVEEKEAEESLDEPYQAAEIAALKLWSTLDGLRDDFSKANNPSKSGQKRKRDVDSTTPSSKIWERMQALEVVSIDTRQRTLEKWWDRVRGSTAPLSGKLNNNVVPMALTSVIQEQLARPGTLQKTQRARSCAPAQEKLKIAEDPNIYDDTTLYKTLLNQLVEQRKMDAGPGVAGAPAQWAVKEAKMRKTVDKKASKGRKMRFTVHEKLQNFMAPEDRSSWEQPAVDRFFGTLLGQKMTLGEEDVDVDDNEEEVPLEEAGLMLFRS